MISRFLIRFASLSAPPMLASCVPPAAPPPAPPPPPASAPVAPPAPLPSDWRDWPVAAGNWSYRPVDGGSLASFGMAGQAALLTLRCDIASRQISVSRLVSAQGDQSTGQMTVHTSFGAAQWPVLPGSSLASSAVYAVATRAAMDAAFDRIVFSRGRFAIEAPGATPIAVPGWAEPSRVVEDCRG